MDEPTHDESALEAREETTPLPPTKNTEAKKLRSWVRFLAREKKASALFVWVIFFLCFSSTWVLLGSMEVGLLWPAMALAYIFGAALLALGGWLGDLSAFAHLRLPGRLHRDKRWLAAWSQEVGAVAERTTLGANQYTISLPAVPKATSSRLLDEGIADHLATIRQLPTPERSAVFRVVAQDKGYRIELVQRFPASWWRALAPCVGDDVLPLASFLPAPLLRGEEAKKARPFVLPLSPGFIDVSELLLLDDAALWVAFRRPYLNEWASSGAFWDEEGHTLHLVQSAVPGNLDATLDSLNDLRKRFWLFLTEVDQPVLQRISCELLARLGRFGERGDERAGDLSSLHWWLLLCQRYQKDEELAPVIHQFLWCSESYYIQALWEDITETLRESLLTPILRDLVAHGWLELLSQELPSGRHAEITADALEKLVAEELNSARFRCWFDLLKADLPAAAYRALCESIVESPVSSQQGARQAPLYAWRVEALYDLFADPEPIQEEKLFQWLGGAEPRLWPLLLEEIHERRIHSPAYEVLVHPCLYADRVWLTPEEQEARAAALRYLAELGTTISAKVIQQVIDTWHSMLGLETIYQARGVLRQLREAPMLGAISVAEGDEAGQLSLTGDEVLEGQLSLMAGKEKSPKGS